MVQTATSPISHFRSLALDGLGRLSVGGRADSWIPSNPPSFPKPADAREPATKKKSEQKQTKATKKSPPFVPFCSRFSNPQFAIRNSQFAIRNPQFAIRNSQSAIRNPQFPGTSNQRVFRDFRTVTLVLALCLGLAAARAQNNNDLPPGVELRTYTGWPNCLFLNASEIPVQAVIVPAVGGRIVHFSLNGTNILLENSASLGAILGAKNEDLFLGGYQCDFGAGGRELPDHWPLSEGPQRWRAGAPFSAKLFSGVDARLGVALEKEFVLAGDTGELGLLQRLRNVSDHPVKYFLADRTICKGGGFVFFPLNRKSRYQAGWALARQAGGKTIYDGVQPASSGVSVLGGVLVAQTGGDATRLGADSDAEWIAYARGRLLFVKYYFYAPWGDYAGAGNSVEVYFDRRATELNPFSPEISLDPGDSLIFPEKWVLLPLEKEVTTAEEARRLVPKIPPPPFRH
jgi:hypothetical protein